ncbi:MAG TPA: hypothetical protein VM866_10590 [Pyrinomonadaceae bacterium]|nr:hypothetical protein [Pyrinomonadaceae bacterium]
MARNILNLPLSFIDHEVRSLLTKPILWERSRPACRLIGRQVRHVLFRRSFGER